MYNVYNAHKIELAYDIESEARYGYGDLSSSLVCSAN